MGVKSNRMIAEVLASLEAQAAFHRERAAFHAEHEARHREQRTAHDAELEEILRRLEAFRAAAAEAVDLADRQGAVPVAMSPPDADLGSRSRRPKIHRMLERIIAEKADDEQFGPVGLTGELNRRFGERLRRPVKANHVSAALRRLGQQGIIHLVRKGRPHFEALYVREDRPQGDPIPKVPR